MAILASARPGGGTLDQTLDTGGSGNVKNTGTMEYAVIADSREEPLSGVLNAFGLPTVGSKSGGMLCKKVSISGAVPILFNSRETVKYTVSADFEDDTSEKTDFPPEVSWDAETVEVRCDKDVENNKDVENSAHEPLILTRPQTVIVLNIMRYYKAADFPPSNIFEYTNTISQGTFWGAPAKHAKMEKIAIGYEEIERENGTKERYAKVSFVVKFKFVPGVSEPWKASLLDFGNKCQNPETQTIECFVDLQGRPGQVKLDGHGNELAAGRPGVYLEFNVYEVKDFGALAIDSSDLGY